MFHSLITRSLLFFVGMLIGAAAIVAQNVARVEAATPAAPNPISENCILDSTIGLLEVYYCEGLAGPDYYVNSFGFVVVVD